MATSKLTEPILLPSEDRLILLPIKYNEIWELYKQALGSFWTVGEIDLAKDLSDFHSLTSAERHLLLHVLAFFASSDALVTENLILRFCGEIQIPEARFFYCFQAAMENIHSEMYALLIDTYVETETEKHHLLHSIVTVPTVRTKAEWTSKWITSDATFAQRLVAFVIVEGLFFSGSFATIFWFRKRNLMPGLVLSNEFISRDEGLHTLFGCKIYTLLQDQLPASVVTAMMHEAVQAETEFWTGAFTENVLRLNKEAMLKYVEYVADWLLSALGYAKHYHTNNPLDFMEMISLDTKANFFERRVSSYAKAGTADDRTQQLIFDSNDF